MSNEQVSMLISILIPVIFALLGAGLIWLGGRWKKLFMRPLGMTLILVAGIALFVNITQLREILVALASIFAVIIAAFSFDESRRLRKDSLEKDNKDRKERWLNEIIEWAKGLEERIFPSGEASILAQIQEDEAVRSKIHIREEIISDLRDLDRALASLDILNKEIKEGDEYIVKLASELDKELGAAVDKVVDDMKIRRELLSHKRQSYAEDDVKREAELVIELIEDKTKPLDGLSLSKAGYETVSLGRNAGTIRESARNVVDKAIKIKVRILKD